MNTTKKELLINFKDLSYLIDRESIIFAERVLCAHVVSRERHVINEYSYQDGGGVRLYIRNGTNSLFVELGIPFDRFMDAIQYFDNYNYDDHQRVITYEIKEK